MQSNYRRAKLRQHDIINLLRDPEEEPITVQELAASYNVSTKTIRRDLERIAKDGWLLYKDNEKNTAGSPQEKYWIGD